MIFDQEVLIILWLIKIIFRMVHRNKVQRELDVNSRG